MRVGLWGKQARYLERSPGARLLTSYLCHPCLIIPHSISSENSLLLTSLQITPSGQSGEYIRCRMGQIAADTHGNDWAFPEGSN